jgi:hypothetical protein
VEEDFLGSNETGFAILRTETDNHSSYYSMQVTRYLDEYEKVPAKQTITSFLARRVKRTILLDVHDYNDPPTKERTVKAQDSSIKLAEVLTQYPARARKWEEAKFAKFSSWKKGSRISSGKNQMLSNWFWAEDEIFGAQDPKPEWELEQAMEDMNSVYLQVSTGPQNHDDDEGSRQTRWICIIPDKTRQIHAHLELQPMYLCAGSYATADEAVKQAREVLKKAKETKVLTPSLEVWSVEYFDSPLCYTLVVRDEMKDIKPKKFKQLQRLLGPDLSPTTSECFVARTQVSEPP